MNYILITNLDNTGIDTLVCDTELDELDIWFMLQMQGSDFDDIKLVDKPNGLLPENTSLQWFTPDREKELQKMVLSQCAVRVGAV